MAVMAAAQRYPGAIIRMNANPSRHLLLCTSSTLPWLHVTHGKDVLWWILVQVMGYELLTTCTLKLEGACVALPRILLTVPAGKFKPLPIDLLLFSGVGLCPG